MKRKALNWFIGSLLVSVAASHADVAFQEIFPNSLPDSPLTNVSWNAAVTANGTVYTGNNGAYGPILSVSDFLYTTGSGAGLLGESWLAWTEDAEVGAIGSFGSITNISVSMSMASQSENIKVAIKVDGAWYVSQEEFNNSSPNVWQHGISLDVQSAAWNNLAFVPGSTLCEGGVAGALSGTVEAIGVFDAHAGDGNKVRVDNLTVEVIPDPDALLNGFIHPPVIFNPGEEYGSEARKYQGIPGIERAPGGRLWATWYAGPIWEDKYNYVLAATSDDDGHTWSDIQLVIDPDGTGPKRAADPCLWLDPDGKLWLFWWMNGDGLTVTMAMTTENPDAEHPVWSEPFPLFSGVMLNKPIVTSKGEWLMPSAMWHRDGSCRVMVSKDGGKTFSLRGTANVPLERRNCDEEMIVERKDGSLWMLVRTLDYGIGESVSTDNGKTWTEVTDYQKHATTRFTLLKLNSGNLMLIRNGPVDQRIGREQMSAYLSDDDGATWKGGLLLDERSNVSYPDATQAPDGTIYATYDWERGRDKNILLATFTEADILAKAFASPIARSKVLINQATGINPKIQAAENAANYADVFYEETFLNPTHDPSHNIALTNSGWHANQGASGTSYTGTIDTGGPILSGSDYLFNWPQSSGSPWLAWTAEVSFGSFSNISDISMKLLNDNAVNEDIKVALKVDGSWYVSQAVLNGGNYVSTLDVQSAAWNNLAFDPGITLAEGTAAGALSGTVLAVGIFDASGTAATKVRMDDFMVYTNAGGTDQYQLWRDSYSLSGSDAEMDADPDCDDMDNLVEYALGGNPTNADASAILPVSSLVDAGSANWLEYVYHRRLDATSRGLTYEVMRNDDLVSGSWTNSGIVAVGVAVLDAEFEAVTNRIPTETESQQFLKLNIEAE